MARRPGARSEGAPNWKGVDWPLLRRIADFARPHWKPLVLSLGLMPLFSAMQLLQPYLIKVAIDGPIANKEPGGLLPIAGLLLVVLLTSYTLQFISSYASHIAGQGIVHDTEARTRPRGDRHVCGLVLLNPGEA